MAIQLSVGVICGIGIGGAVLLLLVFTPLVLIILRRKHQTQLAEIDNESTRRRAHLSITDEDFYRMPGTRRVRPPPYSNSSGWAPVSSHESLAKKSFTPNPADVDPVTGLPPWPVRIPRRLRKAQSSPAVRVPLAALSPITERSTNNTATSPSLSKITDPDTDVKTQASHGTVRGVYRLSSGPSFDMIPQQLHPKPLFHGQQRSFSHNVIASIENIKEGQGPNVTSGDNADHAKTQLALMRRSSSLCSQQPGQAPTIPIPPLPSELRATRKFQAVKSPAEASPRRVSGTSLLSGDTSVLDDMASKAFSQAETDFTSISLSSPPASASTTVGLGICTEDHPKWNFSRVDRSASPLSAAQARNIRPQVYQQHSSGASIHNSLPRSASSGLSMSLLNHNSPNPRAALNGPKSNLRIPGKTAERDPSRRSKVPQSSPLRNSNNVFATANGDPKDKRASTSILQLVSANQISPVKNPWIDRPTSIATDDPFRWDPKTSMQPGRPSAMKKHDARLAGHKRHSCVRISNIPIIIPSRTPSVFDFYGHTISPLKSPLFPRGQNQQKQQHQRNRPSHPSPRPPSLQTFNPHLPRGIRSSHTTTASTSTSSQTPYSPTFSMLPLYQQAGSTSPTRSSSSESPSPVSTPTRPPTTATATFRASHHPNRRRAIFPSSAHSGPGCWPPLLSSSITPSNPPSNLVLPPPPHRAQTATMYTPEKKQASDENTEEGWDSRPPSYLLSFPSPPLFNAYAPPSSSSLSPSLRTSPVRGPRPPPTTRSRVRKMGACSPSSPSPRGSVGRNNRRSRSPAKMEALRKSIMELRRMNSDVMREGTVVGGKGHGRYLSLGDGEGEEAEEEDEGGREREREKGGWMMVRGPREMGTPGSLYDGEGFLRETGGGGRV